MADNELTPPNPHSNPALLQTFGQKLSAILTAAPDVAKSIHNEATAQVAVDYANQVKNFEDEVEASDLAKDRETFYKYHQGLSRMVKQFVDPCKKARGTIQAALDTWRAELRRQAQIEREKQEAKLKKEAEARKLKDAARIDKLKGPKASNAALSRPIVYTPPPIELPKLTGASWKKTYTVEVQDERLFLKFIVEGEPGMEEYVTINTAKLEGLAAQRDGKLTWPGIVVYEGEKGQTQRRSA